MAYEPIASIRALKDRFLQLSVKLGVKFSVGSTFLCNLIAGRCLNNKWK